MTAVIISVDTELSASRQQAGQSARANFESSILGRCRAGDFGIGWQMDRLDAAGLIGTYFVDPLPALVLGEGVVADIVGPIVARGHDVQLHAHTEWLAWAADSPADGRTGRNIGDFSEDDQVAILGYGADVLTRAGAPRPIAFRAGNFGANDATLRALARLGLSYDSSVNPGYLAGECRISAAAGVNMPYRAGGIIELPVSGLTDRPGGFRHAQICAASSAELATVLDHARAQAAPVAMLLTHSFEMLSRDRQRPNTLVMRRFERLIERIGRDSRLTTPGIAGLDADALIVPEQSRAPANWSRTLARHAAQAYSTLVHERRLRPV